MPTSANSRRARRMRRAKNLNAPGKRQFSLSHARTTTFAAPIWSALRTSFSPSRAVHGRYTVPGVSAPVSSALSKHSKVTTLSTDSLSAWLIQLGTVCSGHRFIRIASPGHSAAQIPHA